MNKEELKEKVCRAIDEAADIIEKLAAMTGIVKSKVMDELSPKATEG